MGDGLKKPSDTKKATVKKKTASKKADELVSAIEVRLDIYENLVHTALPGVTKIVVENLGGGDVYASTSSVKLDSKNLIIPGKTKEFKADSVILCSASRPLVRVSQFK